ncbi:MAG: hypothetical protein K0S33_3291 [Bacteroidetes bacterium]|jgi:uncharacterized membrane protein|nr:hypothetical protein [Bacteroidota bacterium]
MKTNDVLLLITALFSALMAGFFYSYSCSVMPGLGKLSDDEFIKAMQSINREIQNPVFFLSFFGILIFLPLSTFLSYGTSLGFWLLGAATLVYFAGAFGVTIFGNIPLNNALDKFDLLQATKEMIAAQRNLFETKWNSLNIIRTFSSSLAAVLVLISCILKEKS